MKSGVADVKDKLIIGRYLPLNSIVHRIDPRAKFLFVFLFIIIIFFSHHWFAYLWLACILLVIIKLARLPLFFFIERVNPRFYFCRIDVCHASICHQRGHTSFRMGNPLY